MNIKGVFQIWMQRRRATTRCRLKECHAWTREGCNHCPDFAAEHADISTGGIGKFNDWTLTIVRTELGREIMSRMIAVGCDRDPAGRRRPRRHRADAQAVAQEPQALARTGDRASRTRAARSRRSNPNPDRPAGERGGR